jgi:hypothetical protein
MRFRYRSPFDLSIFGGGIGSVASFNQPPSGPSYPPYGTFVQWYASRIRLVSEGGGYISHDGNYFPNTYWEVNELANGTGGTFLDWGNALFVSYATGYIGVQSSNSEPIIIDGYNYGSSCSYSNDLYHDGNGGTYADNFMGGCTMYGEYITSGSIPTYLNISGTNYQNGYQPVTYYHDGMGSYYQSGGSTEYYGYGSSIVILYNQPSYLYLYTPDGMTYVGAFQNGTTDVEYFHDGYGSFYSTTVSTNYTPTEGLITEYNYQTDVAGQLHNNGRVVYYYFQSEWNGFYSYAEYTYYYSYGTYIWDDGVYAYFWDGWGGYYSQQIFV